MTDLFTSNCPHCGQVMAQDVNETPFAKFWDKVPHKVNKVAAQKAWKKLGKEDRRNATKFLTAFYSHWGKMHPGASPLHVSTYLNNRRWEDDFLQVKATSAVDRLKAKAAYIKTGKRFLCGDISGAVAHECIVAGLVTREECEAVGVL